MLPGMPANRPLLRDVAQAAGVTVSTASRALAGTRGVSEATRKRVQAMALRLGYEPDPSLAALAAYRRSQEPTQPRGLIALIMPHGIVSGSGVVFHQELIDGTRRRAERLGFDCAILDDGPGLAERVAARPPRGFILASAGEDPTWVERVVGAAPAVWLESRGDPRWPGVITDHFGDLTALLRLAAARGYRRPGLLMPDWIAEGPGADYCAAFTLGAGVGAPLKLLATPDDPLSIGAWVRERGIDVVFHAGTDWPLKRLREQGVAVPAVCGLVALDLVRGEGPVAGLLQGRDRLAAHAVDLLTAALAGGRHDMAGESAPTLMLAARWYEGETLPSR